MEFLKKNYILILVILGTIILLLPAIFNFGEDSEEDTTTVPAVTTNNVSDNSTLDNTTK